MAHATAEDSTSYTGGGAGDGTITDLSAWFTTVEAGDTEAAAKCYVARPELLNKHNPAKGPTQGYTALHIACRNLDAAMIAWLLNTGADFMLPVNVEDATDAKASEVDELAGHLLVPTTILSHHYIKLRQEIDTTLNNHGITAAGERTRIIGMNDESRKRFITAAATRPYDDTQYAELDANIIKLRKLYTIEAADLKTVLNMPAVLATSDPDKAAALLQKTEEYQTATQDNMAKVTKIQGNLQWSNAGIQKMAEQLPILEVNAEAASTTPFQTERALREALAAYNTKIHTLARQLGLSKSQLATLQRDLGVCDAER